MLRGGGRRLVRAAAAAAARRRALSGDTLDASSLAPLARRNRAQQQQRDQQRERNDGPALPRAGSLAEVAEATAARKRRRPESEVQFDKTQVQGHNDECVLVNGVLMHGSVLALPHFLLMWRPRTVHEITPESLSVLLLAHPRPELLLVGTGESLVQLPGGIREEMRRHGIGLEVMSTFHAATTFNLLNEEDRPVAAALLPHGYVE